MFKGTLIREFFQLAVFWKQMSQQQQAELTVTKHAYGRSDRQYFLWVRNQSLPTTKGWVWYLHGGGWQFAKPELFLNQAAFFIQMGYQVILPSFRRIPRYHIDHMLSDAKKILQKVPLVLAEADQSIDHWYMGGMSSGAHLSAQLYFNHDLLAQRPALLNGLRGLFLLGAPLDLTTMTNNPVVYSLAGHRSNARFQRANIMSHLEESVAQLPLFCYHGEKDGMVPLQSTQHFHDRLQELGWNDLSFYTEPDLTHIETASWSMGETEIGRLLREWMEGIEVKK